MTNATLTPPAVETPVSSREQTISAIFETQNIVQDVVKRLIERGVPAEDISVMGRNFESTTRVAGFVTKRDVILGGLKQGAIFGSLFRGPVLECDQAEPMGVAARCHFDARLAARGFGWIHGCAERLGDFHLEDACFHLELEDLSWIMTFSGRGFQTGQSSK